MIPDFQRPALECDLVMKGGITSGVVYPPAILKLAERYRFRSIGGTSAGAIAATVAAAAEYGRERGGFEKLARLRDQLAENGFLFSLFQPANATRSLLHALLALASEWKTPGRGKAVRLGLRLTQALLHEQPKSFAAGALWGAGLSSGVTLLLGGSLNGWRRLAPLLGGWLGGLAKGGYDLSRILLNEIPEHNFFGICTGRSDQRENQGPEVLTDWLHASINDLAGRGRDDPPLTFHDLAAKPPMDGKEVGIKLRMFTTNLSQGRPYITPLDTNTFLFHEHEMRTLFPKSVVDYLVNHAYQSASLVHDRIPEYFFLPTGDMLPVVVGMRLSLSFPVLISAVPLYTINRRAFARRATGQPLVIEPADLQRNWFSDGGICSNFPIHFFDAWLPTRPTFGINLAAKDAEAFSHDRSAIRPEYQSVVDVDAADTDAPDTSAGDGVAQDVYLPRANEVLVAEWTDVRGLGGFVRAIIDAAMNYHDTMQALLPSYRDRVVQVRLSKDEGGLNLAMQPATIARIQQKGAQAADTLETGFRFDHHQWVRFQVLLALMERQLKAVETALGRIDYPQLLKHQIADQSAADILRRFPYPQPEQWCAAALERVHGLRELVQQWDAGEYLVKKPPRPEAVLRVTPEV